MFFPWLVIILEVIIDYGSTFVTYGRANESKGVQFPGRDAPDKISGGANRQSPPIPRKFVALYHRNTKIRMRSDELEKLTKVIRCAWHAHWAVGPSNCTVEPFLIGALSNSLRRPLLRRSEVKKPKNDEVRRLGNNPLPSPKRDAVLWRSRYCSSIKFDVFSCLQFGWRRWRTLPRTPHPRHSDLLKVPIGWYEVP